MSGYSFAAERYDRVANAYFDYTLVYYSTQSHSRLGKGEIEVIEVKTKRRFTRREPTKLALGQLFIGATVVVNSFQFTITAYNDKATEKALSRLHERTLAVVSGKSVAKLGKILTATNGFGFTVARLQTIFVTPANQKILRRTGLNLPIGLTAFMILLRPDAVRQWLKLSERFGDPDDVHGSESTDAATAEIDAVFGSGLMRETSAHCSKNSSLCLIKPHEVQAGHAGAIIQILSDTLNVTAVEQVHLNKEDALEFLTCYRGVLPEFSAQVEALYEYPAIAVEVFADSPDVDAVGALRQLAGPYHVECAKCLAPNSIRAQFGVNNVDNAVHVTDLDTDGQIETNFFFRVLKT